MADEESKGEAKLIGIPIRYVGQDQPAIFANHFVVQIEHDDIILSLAQLTPPIILGPVESWAEQASQIPFLAVQIQGCYAMNVNRARALHEILGQQLANYDATKAERDGNPEPS